MKDGDKTVIVWTLMRYTKPHTISQFNWMGLLLDSDLVHHKVFRALKSDNRILEFSVN